MKCTILLFLPSIKLKSYLLKHQPRLIAIYTNLMTKLNVLRLYQFIRENESLADSIIVTGGPDVRYNAEDYLKNGSDIVVVGEGEQTMLELVENYEKGQILNKEEITGIAYLKDNLLVTNPERNRFRPVDDLPFPNRKKSKSPTLFRCLEKNIMEIVL